MPPTPSARIPDDVLTTARRAFKASGLTEVRAHLGEHARADHLLSGDLIDVERPVLLQQVFLTAFDIDPIHHLVERVNSHGSFLERGG